MPKITVVGAGNVGATCAHALLRRRIADIILIDIDEGLAKGKALDLSQAGAIESFTTSIAGSSDYRSSSGSDVVVVAAGLPRRPGMTREELLDRNAEIMVEVMARALNASPDAIIVVVTNPLDLMSYLAFRTSGLDPRRIVGMGGVLDTARFKHFIAEEVGGDASDVEAMVIGAHSDSMVPLPSLARVGGRPLASLVSGDAIERIVAKTKNGGAEIVSFLKNGSAFYAPGVAAAEMASAVLLNEGRLLPACALSPGTYGVEGLYIGLPVKLDALGAGDIVELPLDAREHDAFSQSAKELESGLAALDKWL